MACRRGDAGGRLSPRFTSRCGKSCESGADSALGLVRSTRWMVFDRTRERVIPQRTGEQFEAPWVKVAPQARNSDRIAEFVNEIVEVVQISPLGRVQQAQRRIAEHMVAVPVPLFFERER